MVSSIDEKVKVHVSMESEAFAASLRAFVRICRTLNGGFVSRCRRTRRTRATALKPKPVMPR